MEIGRNPLHVPPEGGRKQELQAQLAEEKKLEQEPETRLEVLSDFVRKQVWKYYLRTDVRVVHVRCQC